jgi:hypothetical protein
MNNYKPFMQPNYHFLRNVWNAPIHESEMAALKLIQYAIHHHIRLPINYCSKVYKEVFQEKNKRLSHAELTMSAFESATPNGFVRRISLKDTPAHLQALADRFKERKLESRLWSITTSGDTMAIHAEILPQLNLENYQMKIDYFLPVVGKKCLDGFFEPDNLTTELRPVHSSPWFDPDAARAWQAHFITPQDFSLEYEPKGDPRFGNMLRYERMFSGFPDLM